MYLVEGEEAIYVKPTDSLKNIVKPYDECKDVLFSKNDSDASKIIMNQGSFIVLFPQDAHCPGCRINGSERVKKIIGKVKI